MKKAKIMLLSLAVFAIVGAALAFKAKTYAVQYCYTTLTTTDPNSQPVGCPLVDFSKTNPGATEFFYATTKPADKACSEIVCPPLSIVEQ